MQFSDEQLRKVAGENATFLTYDEAHEALSVPSEQRPRVYGFAVLDDNPQILSVGSVEYLDRFEYLAVWVTSTTVHDLIGPA